VLSSLDEESVMTEVKLSDEDSLERALRLFKRTLQTSGLFGELRRRRHYVKPSEARAIKSAAALRRKRKKQVVGGDNW
jgi:small subunit ribosomal protein S21